MQNILRKEVAEAIVNMSKQQKRKTVTLLSGLLAKIKNKSEQTKSELKNVTHKFWPCWFYFCLMREGRDLMLCEGGLSWCPARLKIFPLKQKIPHFFHPNRWILKLLSPTI